jgi:hypothetical protein
MRGASVGTVSPGASRPTAYIGFLALSAGAGLIEKDLQRVDFGRSGCLSNFRLRVGYSFAAQPPFEAVHAGSLPFKMRPSVGFAHSHALARTLLDSCELY